MPLSIHSSLKVKRLDKASEARPCTIACSAPLFGQGDLVIESDYELKNIELF